MAKTVVVITNWDKKIKLLIRKYLIDSKVEKALPDKGIHNYLAVVFYIPKIPKASKEIKA